MATNLSILCRCGHARRFHRSGSLLAGGDDSCNFTTHPGVLDYSDSAYCYYFEAADGWEESFAKSLRKKGWLVQRPARDESGRFAPARAER